MRGDVRTQLTKRRRRPHEMCLSLLQCISFEGGSACQEMVQRATETVEICANIDRVGVQPLFGRHVLGRPHAGAGPLADGERSDGASLRFFSSRYAFMQ